MNRTVTRRRADNLRNNHEYEKCRERPAQHHFRQSRQQPAAKLRSDDCAAGEQQRGDPVHMSGLRVRNHAGDGGRNDRGQRGGDRMALCQAKPDQRRYDNRAAADAEQTGHQARQHAHHHQCRDTTGQVAAQRVMILCG